MTEHIISCDFKRVFTKYETRVRVYARKCGSVRTSVCYSVQYQNNDFMNIIMRVNYKQPVRCYNSTTPLWVI